ncbi:hypothetical protein HanIR_Chr17g0850011 [Helianthus annuus]|nr:hypothetical protein HanIR_Chr17g0850011 [Helianthus annuus]
MSSTTSIITAPSKRCDPTPPQTFSPEKSPGDVAAKATVAGGVTLKAATPELLAKSSVVVTDGDEVSNF